MHRPLLVLVVAGLFSLPIVTGADVGPLQEFKGGGVVAPDHPHPSIRLDSQEVVIRLKSRSDLVDAVFHLFNTGETTVESVGFPTWVAAFSNSLPTFISFEGSVDGTDRKFDGLREFSRDSKLASSPSLKNKESPPTGLMNDLGRWMVCRVAFPGHAPTSIHVRYEARYYGKGYRQASYLYGTGSLWKGKIKKAVFIVDSSEVGGNTEISTYFENGSALLPASENIIFGPGPSLESVARYEIRDFKPNPEEYFRIKLHKWLGLRKRNHVRFKIRDR